MIDQNNFGNPAFNMYQGLQPQQVTKRMNYLSDEEINQLLKSGSSFSLAITNDERMRAICNHRTLDGTGDSLTKDPTTGALKCSICGYTFRQVDMNTSKEDIKETIYVIIDMLQTIKLMFIDMPAEAAREYFLIIPLLEKIPELFEIAAKNMTKHETFGWNYQNPNMPAYQMFTNLQNIFGQGMMGVQPQPTAPQPMMQPGYNPQPNFMNQPMQQPQSNGFGFVGGVAPQPTPMYQPQANGYQYAPGVVPATPTIPQISNSVVDSAASETPAAPTETTVKQTVKA